MRYLTPLHANSCKPLIHITSGSGAPLAPQASKAKDEEMTRLHKASADTSSKLQKALENLTTAQVRTVFQSLESG